MEILITRSSSTSISTTGILACAPHGRRESILDTTAEAVRSGCFHGALDDLFNDLAGRRDDEPEGWAQYAAACREHPIRRLLHQDPFTWRAFSKPRGYAGDAVMMDYIYGLGDAASAARGATPIGAEIMRYMGTRPSARAVRYRRQLLAELIDHTAERGGDRVFALAAGHVREIDLSRAVRDGSLTEFVAVDQDEASLSVVAHDYAHLGVQAVPGSVRQILAGKGPRGQFDLVYAAGLYDYLDDAIAAALTRRLFAMTRPGGTLLIPNFKVGARDTGYMESFMDWTLIYRDHAAMERLVASLPGGEVDRHDIFDDESETITFLLVSKRHRARRLAVAN